MPCSALTVGSSRTDLRSAGSATALAIGRVPYAAGAGSAVLGTLQHALAAVVAPLVGLGGDHDAVAMAVGMALLSAMALASLALTRWRSRDLVTA
ncbi:hypothetical protein [Nonomuraea africana]|uniref:MFS transporter n=1 Tax=Nonomuraea africana TaxID=46171 RepID=A0ABR9K716_9ACTN|nr:hypothetical protein [Nonomuraea africana]MBE1557799.1 hypothetical protein [Nonomuraea africana]